MRLRKLALRVERVFPELTAVFSIERRHGEHDLRIGRAMRTTSAKRMLARCRCAGALNQGRMNSGLQRVFADLVSYENAASGNDWG